MSRIGKQPITLPEKVSLTISEGTVTVSGPGGKLERPVPPHLKVEVDGSSVLVTPLNEDRKARAMQGLGRTLISNMVTGVTKGFTKVLEIHGVGYRAEKKGDFVIFNLGYSHPIWYELPIGIEATVEQTKVTLKSADREQLGQAAAVIRSLRPPEPYKGKGIRYQDEMMKLKVGKVGAAG